MAIITNENLKKEIKNFNLFPLEVSVLNITNKVYLEIDNIDEFLKFASVSKFEFVYYYYTYYKCEEYIIPIDWYSEHSKEFKTKAHQHNRLIESLDFASPKSLTLFILQNGTFVGVKLYNPWIENQDVKLAEETIEEIENEFYLEVKKITSSNKVQRKDDEKTLRGIIFNDPEFAYCKNQELRYWYLVELLEKEDMKKYEYLVKPYGAPQIGKVKMFMDKTWILYKERKK